jgi:hypothetical protein
MDAMRHNYFYACLESKLVMRIRSATRATSAVLNPVNGDPDPTSLELLLCEQFNIQDSIFARRYRLMDKCHQQGTRFMDWMNKMTAESDECDLAGMTPDLFLAGQFTAKCADPELQKELMKTDGMLKAIRDAAVAYERHSGDLCTYSEKVPTGHISAVRGNCPKCGGVCASGSKCPADNSSCMYCSKRGHWACVCRKRSGDGASSGRSKSPDRSKCQSGHSKPKKTEYKKAKERGESYTDKNKKGDGNASKGTRPRKQNGGGVNTVHLVEEEADGEALPLVNTVVRARNTPRLIVRINGYEQKIAALPDTCACLSLIILSWIEEFDLWHMVDTSAPPRLSTATSSSMEVSGTINLQLTVILQERPARVLPA